MKLEDSVKKDIIFVAGVSLVLEVVMQAVFLVIGQWDSRVLWGGLLGYIIGVGNFFLLGVTVQKAVMLEEKEAKQRMKASQGGRTVAMFALLALGAALPVFNTVATVIPILFPRVAVALSPLRKKGEDTNNDKNEAEL